MTRAAEPHPALPLPMPLKLMLGALAFYACFIGMEIVHEFGHVLHAIASGGRVVAVEIPLIGTSQTLIAPNPNELLEVIGGPLWGVLIPLFACLLSRRLSDRVPEPLKFFTGFCFIANGAYLAVGWRWPGTDAGQLVRLDVPPETLAGLGIVACIVGLGIWHQLPWLTRRRRRAEV